MKRTIFAVAIAFAASGGAFAQEQFTQTIRGRITDQSNGQPIPFANVQILEIPTLGTMTNENGEFVIEKVPVGRYTVQGSMVGYSTTEMKEQMVSTGKALYLDMTMQEELSALEEFVVKVKVNKQQPLNTAATVGARMFSMEEVSRMPGAAEDPARHASSMAGVGSDGSSNGISIHGNAPHLLAWRIEGVEIPNPNHYADLSVMGGGIFSSLSTKVMGNSDFFTSAFPAEYNNAVSGIFDMKMRNGNSQNYEHAFQAGVLGFDFASEGPIGKSKKASYLVNYRYSFLGLGTKLGFLDLGGQELDYQDINFKVNIPTKKAGTFALWGTGLIDNFVRPMVEEKDWKYKDDAQTNEAKQKMLATGLTHKYFFENDANLKTTLAYTINSQHATCDFFYHPTAETTEFEKTRNFESKKTNADIILTSSFNKKYNKKFSQTFGFTLNSMHSDIEIDNAPTLTSPMIRFVDSDNSTMYSSVFNNNQWQLGIFKLNAGISYQYLAINKTGSVEPRLGAEWSLGERWKLAMGFGIHSRKENTDIYFVERNSERVNKDLGFTHAQHYSLGVACKLGENLNLRIEPYYQWLYDIPVEEGTGFSMINNINFLVDKDLCPDGKGRNFGVDITLEKYMSKGWYGMLTGSIFSSKFMVSDGNWYHSRYDRLFITNIVGGKEWFVGKKKNNVLNISGKYTFQGPERTTPIDMEASLAHPDKTVVYDETKMFTEKLEIRPAYAFSVNFKVNKAKVAHNFIVDYQKSTSFYGHKYNMNTGEYDQETMSLSFPQIAYRIEF